MWEEQGMNPRQRLLRLVRDVRVLPSPLGIVRGQVVGLPLSRFGVSVERAERVFGVYDGMKGMDDGVDVIYKVLSRNVDSVVYIVIKRDYELRYHQLLSTLIAKKVNRTDLDRNTARYHHQS
jgi:hypothetical protein